MTSVRFLIAAACMAVGPSLGAANLFPTSPLIQLGNDTDIFFDSSFALDITDNLYTTANAVSATSWTVTPGLALEYGKDSSFAVTLSARRNIVRYNKASLADLEDDRDALSATRTTAMRFPPPSASMTAARSASAWILLTASPSVTTTWPNRASVPWSP
ncbi:MAG: hypothetical protein RL304_924 [Verrucomicrobiota bacterium]